MIGKFGVGFYSSYLVADEVEVHTKNNEDDQYSWISKSSGIYTIQKSNSYKKLERGTHIVLHLKEDMREFLEFLAPAQRIAEHIP